jgi:exosortase/archaeosortase family protein
MAQSVVNQPRLSEPQRFGLRFFALLILASMLAWMVSLPDRLGPAQRGLAGSGTAIARLTGGNGKASGDQISVGSLSLDINYECTGVYVVLILFVFLFAYPASWSARLVGAAIGVVALTVINILRIAFLVRVAEVAPDLFAYFHEYVWQGVFLVLVIAYAMTWVERVR